MELLLAQRMCENRKPLGLTQEELAGRLSISPQTVSYWENGGYPDITMLPVIDNSSRGVE
jgi:transcriptional regulator with XRE-family HTH domain